MSKKAKTASTNAAAKSTAETKWKFVETHDELVGKLDGLSVDSLQSIRMMGTMIGAAGAAHADLEYEDTKKPLTDKITGMAAGLVEQTARLIFNHWKTVQSLLLIGSCDESVPMDQAPYQYYTHLFVARVVFRLIELLKADRDRTDPKKHRHQQLEIRITFVPEDILFAQFFFDEQHLILAASYSWNTRAELTTSAYAAVHLDNRLLAIQGNAARHRPAPKTSRRLVKIFDARFREQADMLGEEVWILKRRSKGRQDWQVQVDTPFWRARSKSISRTQDRSGRRAQDRSPRAQDIPDWHTLDRSEQVFDFRIHLSRQERGKIEPEILTATKLKSFLTQVENIIGQAPIDRDQAVESESLPEPAPRL